MFIAALFTITMTWQQSKFPSEEEWKKLCGTYMQWNITQPSKRMEYWNFTETWMDLEILILSEVSQKQKDKYNMLLLICGILKKWYK